MAANHTWTGNMHNAALNMSSLICHRKKYGTHEPLPVHPRPRPPLPWAVFSPFFFFLIFCFFIIFLSFTVLENFRNVHVPIHKIFMNVVDEPSERAQKKSSGACGGSKLSLMKVCFGLSHRKSVHVRMYVCVCTCARVFVYICFLLSLPFWFFCFLCPCLLAKQVAVVYSGFNFFTSQATEYCFVAAFPFVLTYIYISVTVQCEAWLLLLPGNSQSSFFLTMVCLVSLKAQNCSFVKLTS